MFIDGRKGKMTQITTIGLDTCCTTLAVQCPYCCRFCFIVEVLDYLKQEVVVFLRKMADGCLDVRLCRRVVNVLILFQSVAANTETRQKFVDSRVPNFLVPLILFESSLKEFENIRVVALSVIGILCQTREPQITQWAIESNMIEMCRVSLVLGSELAKVIGMHILEALLQDESGISYICSPSCNNLLTGLMKTWEHLVRLPTFYSILLLQYILSMCACEES
ncbi:hypothetical protein GIB67_031488 [Kingdonia uniflora]|uniref:Cell differentiation protein rcd1 n=1 Tax=Kingdonia uniflora TaxID=39325 RepID=A0A7J7MNH7_9MAGN|nr:hypothetical protein GIB67_031488 [Kingdonia uniflora]